MGPKAPEKTSNNKTQHLFNELLRTYSAVEIQKELRALKVSTVAGCRLLTRKDSLTEVDPSEQSEDAKEFNELSVDYYSAI